MGEAAHVTGESGRQGPEHWALISSQEALGKAGRIAGKKRVRAKMYLPARSTGQAAAEVRHWMTMLMNEVKA